MEYRHVQGKRILKRLARQQHAMRLKSCPECSDSKCGWAQYHQALFEVPWFPCVHTLGSDEVNWFKPTDPPEPCSGENDVVIAQYDGDWQIPAATRRNNITVFLEEVAWNRSSWNVTSFIDLGTPSHCRHCLQRSDISNRVCLGIGREVRYCIANVEVEAALLQQGQPYSAYPKKFKRAEESSVSTGAQSQPIRYEGPTILIKWILLNSENL
jgi:hypothetical protein